MPVVKPHRVQGTENQRSEPSAHDLAQVLEHSGEAVIVKDLNAVVTYWNREATSLYGYSAEEAIGQPLRKLHAAELSRGRLCVCARARSRGTPDFIDHRPAQKERRNRPRHTQHNSIAGRARRVGRRDHDRTRRHSDVSEGRSLTSGGARATSAWPRPFTPICCSIGPNPTDSNSTCTEQSADKRNSSWTGIARVLLHIHFTDPCPGRHNAVLAGRCDSRGTLDPPAANSMDQCDDFSGGRALDRQCGCGT